MVFNYLFRQTPLLVVYVAGIVLALKLMRRARQPAIFVLGGSTLLLCTSLGWTFVYATGGAILNAMGRTIWIGFASTCLHAIGIGLIMAGAFTGRRAVEAGFPVYLASDSPRFEGVR